MNNYVQRVYQHFNWVDWDCYSSVVLSADDLNSKRDKVWSALNNYLLANIGPDESAHLEVGMYADPDIYLKYHIFANAQIYPQLDRPQIGQFSGTIGLAAVGVPRNPPPAPPGPPIIDSINLMPTQFIFRRSEISTFSDNKSQPTILHQLNA